MINIAEILDKCTRGTKLYSPIFGDVYLEKIRPHLAVIVNINKDGKNLVEFLYDGRYTLNGECMLFPSKDNRDWNTFQIPFKDGDIIAKDDFIAIFSHSKQSEAIVKDQVVYYHCYLGGSSCFKSTKGCGVGYISDFRFASESEKQKLFDAIKTNGYKWNDETKTLEKLIIPKFKVGDEIVKKNSISNSFIVNSVSCEYYGLQLQDKSGVGVLNVNEQDDWEIVLPKHKFKSGDKIVKKNDPTVCWYVQGDIDTYYCIVTEGGIANLQLKDQDDWKLVPNKFDISTLKPFDKVLVRDTNEHRWCADMFSHYSGHDRFPFCTLGSSLSGFSQCIPYEGNEHLIGTINDCDEYYKNW